MLIEVLVAAAVNAAAPSPAPGVAGAVTGPTVITNPSWRRIPSGQDVARYFPADAARRGLSGSAVIQCLVSAGGLLEDCAVIAEAPLGEGFGAAAVAMGPLFEMKPRTIQRLGEPARAVEGARITIPIRFQAYGGSRPPPPIPLTGSRLAGSETQPLHSTPAAVHPRADSSAMIMLTHPVWAAAPGFADVAAAWPARGGAGGRVLLRCAFNPRTGAPGACETAVEDPANAGLGKAARALAKQFRLSVGPDLASLHSVWAQIPFHFVDPHDPELTGRHIAEPTWIAFGATPAALFPAKAAAAGLKTGRGVARCVVGPDGALSACRPLSSDPPDMGFAEAAVKAASAMKMSPWTEGGGPVDGATIDLPIRFERPPGAPNATSGGKPGPA